MLKIFKKKKKLKKLYKQTWQKYYNIFSISFKQNKKRSLLLIPENKGDRTFIVPKTKMLKDISRIKYFKCINFLTYCQSNTFLLINIII